MKNSLPLAIAATIYLTLASPRFALAEDAPLPSWTEGKTRDRIVDFVRDVINPSSKSFVPPEDRFATFDNDGTILCEKPSYFEVIYTRDRAREVESKHPEWATNEAVQSFIHCSDADLGSIHTSESMKVMAQSAGDLSLEALREPQMKWLDTAKHERFKVLYKKLHYQPMIELLNYLRANGFKIYLCSGGQADFMRCYSREEYGIGPEQVIGSSLELEFVEDKSDGRSQIMAKPRMQLFNINANKPISISQHLGKRPVIACGNSDGDLQMLQYATDKIGPSLSILIHHDDAVREYAYDKGAEKVLPVAAAKGWLVVSMKDDFKRVFDF